MWINGCARISSGRGGAGGGLVSGFISMRYYGILTMMKNFELDAGGWGNEESKGTSHGVLWYRTVARYYVLLAIAFTCSH